MLTTWRSRGIAAAIGLVLLVISFGAGRYSRPAKVVTRDVVRTEVQVKTVVQEKVVHDVAVQSDTKQQTRTVVVTRWLPAPGGRTEVVQESHVEAIGEAKTERRGETMTQAQTSQESHATQLQEHTVTITAARPQWSVTALAGASLGSPLHLIPGLPGPLVVGAQLERRILGPLSAGLWATSSGAGGVSVRLEF